MRYAEQTDDWKLRHERACARLVVMEANARQLLTVFGPRVPLTSDTRHEGLTRDPDSMVIFRCREFPPPVKFLTCPVCDHEFPDTDEDRWRYRFHLIVSPKWCEDRGKLKAKRWSANA